MIGSCILFLTITTFVSLSPSLIWHYDFNKQDNATLTLPQLPALVKCNLYQMFPEPSLTSFILATTSSDRDFLLSGLAVYSERKNACQQLEDVSKAKVQLHKVALVTLKNKTTCPFQKLAVSAQNAGYAVLIHFGDIPNTSSPSSTHEDKLLIPVLNVKDNECTQDGYKKPLDPSDLSKSDRTNVEIWVQRYGWVRTFNLALIIRSYTRAHYLNFWCLVGPIITLEWLRRKKKFCWMSDGQQLNNNGHTDENEAEIRTMEEGESGTEGSHPRSTIENYRDRDGEEQPLLTTQPTVINDYTRQPRGTGCACVNIIRKISLREIAVGFLYVILVIAALPVGISNGGSSFFVFGGLMDSKWPIYSFWPTFQIFCFLLYSQFACKNTWTIQTECSKLIRSDWFASNIYLLVLGVAVPYCSRKEAFSYFIVYNTLCTVCNVLFILILNKHKVVTRYVFYISICMICAYVESDIMAGVLFVFNLEEDLSNLKLTAFSTVATGLTLTISLNSSMHIVRKLVKPCQSLFEGLSEK